MIRRFKKIPILFLLYLVFVLSAAFSQTAAKNPDTVADELLKKIAIDVVKKSVAGSESIDEAANKLSITSNELKELLLSLEITPPFIIKKEPVPLPPSSNELTNNLLGPDTILAFDGFSPHLILVDKASHSLHLFHYENGNRTLVHSFECKTGKNLGDKEKEGDQKTPEGTFFFVNKYSRPNLLSMVGREKAFLYGDMAFVTDFPNSIDRMHGKNGGGIWLHGTDKPFDQTSPNDTRGCVATTNDDINTLSSYIDLYKTPIVIVDSLTVRPKAELDKERDMVLGIMESWRTAWEKERTDDYASFYSSRFRSQNMSLKQWVDRKRAIFNVYNVNHVRFDKFSIFKHNSGYVITFRQDYSATNIKKNTGIKTLLLVHEDSGWKILSEHFRGI